MQDTFTWWPIDTRIFTWFNSLDFRNRLQLKIIKQKYLKPSNNFIKPNKKKLSTTALNEMIDSALVAFAPTTSE